jgi:NifB/MoaA-like Fe-S oxidoreductase
MPDAIIKEALRQGAIPLTSSCNLDCVFCSNRYNPPGVEVLRMAPRSSQEVLADLRFLPSRGRLVIGEAATRVLEGEPFTSPGLFPVLEGIRGAFPSRPIQVTTNGTLADPRDARVLKRLGVELVVSLNLVDPGLRRRYLGDTQPERAPRFVEALSAEDVPFHGSIVCLSHLVGEDEVVRTASFLERAGALSLRLITAGGTRLAPSDLLPGPGVVEGVAERLESLVDMPVFLEPSLGIDGLPVVAAVLRGSPAFHAGIRQGDVILEVDGRPVTARAQAHALCQAENPELLVRRGGIGMRFRVTKGPHDAGGLVFQSDLPPGALARLDELRQGPGAAPVALCSRRARDRLISIEGLEVLPVENAFFGGNIESAGLLTAGDFARMARAVPPGSDLVLLPRAPWDSRGRDLLGTHYYSLAEVFGCRVEVI